MNKIKEFFAGKKTILATIGLVCQAVYDLIGNGDMLGFVDKVTEALGLSTIRDGVKKLPILKSKIFTWLDGKKTYVLMAINLINSLAHYSATGDSSKLINDILVALGFMGIRTGINTVNNQ